jgi:hypothetical protein
VPSRAFLFINDPLDHFDVHRIVADLSYLGRDTRPMEKSTAIPGEAGARRNALCIVIGRRGIHREKALRVLSTKAGESSPPPYPL